MPQLLATNYCPDAKDSSQPFASYQTDRVLDRTAPTTKVDA